MDSHHIDPGNGGFLRKKVTALKGLQLFFLKTLAVVFYHRGARLLRQLLPDMDQRPRGKPCFFGTFFSQLGHN